MNKMVIILFIKLNYCINSSTYTKRVTKINIYRWYERNIYHTCNRLPWIVRLIIDFSIIKRHGWFRSIRSAYTYVSFSPYDPIFKIHIKFFLSNLSKKKEKTIYNYIETSLKMSSFNNITLRLNLNEVQYGL